MLCTQNKACEQDGEDSVHALQEAVSIEEFPKIFLGGAMVSEGRAADR